MINLINGDCLKKMGINEFDIIPALNMLGFKIEYGADITQDMRRTLFIEAKKEDFKTRVDEYFLKMKKDNIKNKRKSDSLYAIMIK